MNVEQEVTSRPTDSADVIMQDTHEAGCGSLLPTFANNLAVAIFEFAGTDSIPKFQTVSRAHQHWINQLDQGELNQLNTTSATNVLMYKPSASGPVRSIRIPQTQRRKLQAALSTSTHPLLRDHLANSPRLTTRIGLTLNPSLSVALQLKLAQDKSPLLQQLLASRAYLHPTVFTVLVQQGHEQTTATVAGNKLAPQHLLRATFNTNPSELIKAALGSNTNCPVDLFGFLAKDSSPAVRKSVAGNTSAPRRLVNELTLDPSAMVAKTALQNPCAHPTKNALERLGFNGQLELAQSKHSLAPLLDCLAYFQNQSTRRAIANHDNTGAGTVRRLAHDFDPLTQAAAIQHPNLPPEELTSFQQSNTPFLVCAVARSMNSFSERLNELEKHKNFQITEAVLTNRNCPADLLEKYSNSKHPSLAKACGQNVSNHPDRLLALSFHPDLHVQAATGANTAQSPHRLHEMAAGPHFQVVEVVAENTAIAENTMLFLTTHASRQVRNNLVNNRSLTPHVIQTWVEQLIAPGVQLDHRSYLLQKLVQHTNAPIQTRVELIEHTTPEVAQCAFNTLIAESNH